MFACIPCVTSLIINICVSLCPITCQVLLLYVKVHFTYPEVKQSDNTQILNT